MPEIKTIPTSTQLFKYTNELEIFTFYNDPNCNAIAFISNVVDVINAVSYIENQLLIDVCDPRVDFTISANGELIANGPGSNEYSVDDASGNLQVQI